MTGSETDAPAAAPVIPGVEDAAAGPCGPDPDIQMPKRKTHCGHDLQEFTITKHNISNVWLPRNTEVARKGIYMYFMVFSARSVPAFCAGGFYGYFPARSAGKYWGLRVLYPE